MPAASDFAAILEYELPRDDRRPDVIVLENGTVIVIEFKEAGHPSRADIDQVSCYARDLKHYHSASHDREIVPILVPLGYSGDVQRRSGVIVVPPVALAAEIVALATPASRRPDARAWLDGDYAPLPGLAQAARMLFERQPLPRIKRAASAGVHDVVDRLLDIAAQAHRDRVRKLAFVTGVPGSGKTLVGLQLVHAGALEGLVEPQRRGAAPGIFLSGNDPLVSVLQRSLGGNKDFVLSLRHYLKQHVLRSTGAPPEHVLVFDEAQRAWDGKRVQTKHKGDLGPVSEPELLLRIADRIPDWCLVVALVGQGQEIHLGEEAGLDLWCEAVGSRAGWSIHAPARVAARVRNAGVATHDERGFDLDTTLRTHAAGEVHAWVSAMLRGELSDAASIVPRLEGYSLYVTRDLDAARRYVRNRYAGRDSRFGLLASACAENLRGFAPRIKEENMGIDYGRWYEGSRSGKNFCCSLQTAVSEFGCQGLELDFAVLCWGDDLSWTGDAWRQVGGKRKSGAVDRQRLRANAYRVLLTRGRDGTCIFVPPGDGMDAVHAALLEAGVEPLTDA